MKFRLPVKTTLLTACLMLFMHQSLAGGIGTVADIYADQNISHLLNDHGDLWLRMSHNENATVGPSQWLYSSNNTPYVTAVLPVLKASGFGGFGANPESLLLISETTPRRPGSSNTREIIKWMYVSDSDNTAFNTVDFLFLNLDSSASDNVAMAVSINNGTGGDTLGLVNSTSQAAIAANAIANNQPVDWGLGCIYFYNSVANMLEQNCSVLEYITLN